LENRISKIDNYSRIRSLNANQSVSKKYKPPGASKQAPRPGIASNSVSLSQGTVARMVAKVFYILTSLAIHIVLARSLGPAAYGKFGVIMVFASVIYLALGGAIPPAMSWFISARVDEAGTIFRIGMKIQALVCTALTLITVTGGGVISSWILGDAGLSLYVRLIGLSFLPLGLLYIYERAMLGKLNFVGASILSIIASAVNLFCVVGAVGLDGELSSVLMAYFAAPALVLGLAAVFIRFGRTNHRQFQWRRLISFSVPMLVIGVVASLNVQISTLMVNRLLRIEEMIGIFVAAAVFANVPYRLFVEFSAVLMPTTSHADSKNDRKALKDGVISSFRLLSILSIPFVFWLALTIEVLIDLFYGQPYHASAVVVVPLACGTTLLSWGRTSQSIIEGLGRPWVSVVISTICVLLIVTCNLLLIPQWGLLGASFSVCLGGLIMLLLSLIYLWHNDKIVLPFVSLFRAVIASGISYLAASSIRISGINGLAITTCVFGLIYLSMLWILREVRKEDFADGLMKKIFAERH
jgi:O-antigen/teichoic acid export membrane protein